MYERFWFERYQPKRRDVIVDIGAGKGEDIEVFCRAVTPGGRVVAVEAHPVAYAELEKVCRQYHVDCVRAACVGLPGSYWVETTANYEACYVFQGPPTATSFAVRGLTLAELLTYLHVSHIDLLKMNIEGSELEALQGSSEVLAQVSHAVIACHDFKANRGEGERYHTAVPVCKLLAAAGFDYWVKPDWFHVHAWRRDGR